MKRDSKNIVKETALISIFILFLTLFLEKVPLNFEIFKPLKEALHDMEPYDLIYKNYVRKKIPEDVFIVQAENSRVGIAKQLHKLRQYKPAVIGLDILFSTYKEQFADSLLTNEVSQQEVITGYKLYLKEDGTLAPLPNFFQKGFHKSGYFNLAGEEVDVVRYFPPFRIIDGTEHFSFASRIIQKYDSKKFAIFRKQAQDLQVINYRGNIQDFQFLKSDLQDTVTLKKIQGKIVLVGIAHDSPPYPLEDFHFTPLNKKQQGKSFPDMYGVLIHANIISMMLDEGPYIKRISAVWPFLITLLIVFMLIYVHLKKYVRGKHPAAIISILFHFLLIALLIFFALVLYKNFHIRTDLSPIVIPIALTEIVIESYKWIVKKWLVKFGYSSIFVKKHTIV